MRPTVVRAFLLLGLLASPALAQINTATISGTIKDETGGYLQSVVDQFDALYADSAKQPRVMGIPLHPMITGQPLRIKYLERALAHMKQRDKVWFATGREIVDAYQRAALS
jgi:hypothetical protein